MFDQPKMPACVAGPFSLHYASQFMADLRPRSAPGGHDLGVGRVRWNIVVRCWSSAVAASHHLRR